MFLEKSTKQYRLDHKPIADGRAQKEYIARGNPAQTVINSDYLEKYLHEGDDNPEINYQRLKEAADFMFGDRKGMPLQEYLKITEEFYKTLDLETRGMASILLDTDILLTYFTRACEYVKNKTSKLQRTNRVLIIGCGSGRLSDLYIEMAKKFGIKEIAFNDLLEFHVTQTKEKLQEIYNVRSPGFDDLPLENIKVQFLPGDFTALDLRNTPYDIAIAMWFVTSEILNPNSPQKLRERRIEFFGKVRESLIAKGIFIEDIPESGLPGFYYLARMKTLDILRNKNVLPGEEANFSLTNVSKKAGGYPYHLRYLPYNGTHSQEMSVSGLHYVDSISKEIPTDCLIEGPPKFVPLFKKAKSITEVQMRMTSLVSQWLERVSDSDADGPLNDSLSDKKIKKVALWTPEPTF